MANRSLKTNYAASDKRRQKATNCDKFIAAFCRSVSSRLFSERFRWEMVSAENCPQIRARQTRDIRIEPMFGNVPINTCQRIGVGIMRANRMFHCGSPGSVSRYSSPCYPLRSILTRRPATYNGTFDSRAQHPRQCVDMVLTGTFPNIGSMRISRVCLALICGQFSADTISQAQACGKNRRKTEAVKSDKRRQRTCRNLPLFVTGSCRNLLLSVQCN